MSPPSSGKRYNVRVGGDVSGQLATGENINQVNVTRDAPAPVTEAGGGPEDGRNVDPRLGRLEGEAADQKVPGDRSGGEGAVPFDVWPGPPSGSGPAVDPTYYDRPVLKEPVWKWYVPAYFYLSGRRRATARP